MLNAVHVEGIVTKTWGFQGTRFVRIACYPDPGRTLKRSRDGRDEPEYITLRFEPPLAMATNGLKNGDRVRASGYLMSREYTIPLSRFAESAEGDAEAVEKLKALAEEAGDKVRKPHVLNEVVVEHFVTLSG